jgi:hypothetical protein
MNSLVLRTLAATSLLAGGLFTASAHAAARQYVVVVSEGLSPQVLDIGKSYLRKSNDEPDESTAFDALLAAAKPAKVGAAPLFELSGLLEAAETSGYKTGFVTTGDITADMPIFYDISGEVSDALTAANAKYDFIAGGGGAKLAADTGDKIKAAGGTYLPDENSLDSEMVGRVLAPQAQGDLDYSIDRDPATQAGLTELAVLAIDTMGAGDTPFVLIVHDTLIKKALETKDSPGLVEQVRELNSIVTDASSRHEDNPDFRAAFVFTGGLPSPRFNTSVVAEQQSALLTLSNMLVSFAGAGKKLQGADADAITTFADPTDGLYRGWKVTPEVRDQIAAGTLAPEAALRAAFEPILKLDYTAPVAAPLAYTLGLDATDGLGAALKAAVAAPVPVKVPVPEEEETPRANDPEPDYKPDPEPKPGDTPTPEPGDTPMTEQ